jgi:hypothetical protein
MQVDIIDMLLKFGLVSLFGLIEIIGLNKEIDVIDGIAELLVFYGSIQK